MLELNPHQIEALPLIPLILCAKAEGGVTGSERTRIMEAGIDFGLSRQALDVVTHLLDQELSSHEFDYLFALKNLLGDADKNQDKKNRLMHWCALVCAATQEQTDRFVSDKEAAMLQSIAKILGYTNPEKLLIVLSDLIEENIPAMASLEIRKHFMEITRGILKNSESQDSVAVAKKFTWFNDMLPINGITLESRHEFDHDEFLRLLAGSISLNRDSKKRILQGMPQLSDFQIRKLFAIFYEEIKIFDGLNQKYEDEVELQALQSKCLYEWLVLYKEFTTGQT